MSGCGSAVVTLKADESDFSVFVVNCTEKVAGERESAVENAYEERRFSVAVFAYLYSQLGDSGCDFIFSDIGLECHALVCHVFHCSEFYCTNL